MLNFYFLTKGLGLVSPPHFLHYFLGKLLLMLHSINWPNFIVWLPLLLDISGNMCIVIVLSSFFPRYVKYVNKQTNKKKTFEIYLSFLIKPFSYMTRNSEQKLKFVKNEKSLRWNKKLFSSFLKDFQKMPEIVLNLTVCLELG